MSVDSIRSVVLPGKIWNVVLDEPLNVLYLDVREGEQINIVRFDLLDLSFESKPVEWSRWTQLIGADNNSLNFKDYQDPNDPNVSEQFTFEWHTGQRSEHSVSPRESLALHPSIYEHGSDYHQTVTSFLALDLPLSCEYLEWNEKIIISYYLRSNKDFERHLLLISNGEKEWKILQDDKMKGFSPGSFFVFEGQIIFIKDRNEICVYAN